MIFKVPKNCNFDTSNCNWLTPISELEKIGYPDYNHAYILPDNTIWVLSTDGENLIQINETSSTIDKPTQIKNDDGYLVVKDSGSYEVTIDIDLEKFRKELQFVETPRYPFSRKSTINNKRISESVIDVQLINSDPTKTYCIGGLFKNNKGLYRLLIFEYDVNTNELGTLVSEFNVQGYVPSNNVEWLQLTRTINAGSFDSRVLIDWSKLEDGDVFGTGIKGDLLLFDEICSTRGSTSDILKSTLGLSRNENNSFPNYAYFMGNWEKRTFDGVDVMTSTLPTVGMQLGFYGTELKGLFKKEIVGIQLTIRIDGGTPFLLWIDDDDNPTLIATGLEKCEHVVEIYCDPYFGKSLSDKHSFYNYKGCLNVVGFEQTTYPLAIPKNRKTIFFYGDSFTAGGGASMVESYANFCADNLGAEAIRIAQGGAPLVERSDRLWVPTLPEISFNSSVDKRTIPNQADFVVINIGTNDTPSAVSSVKYEEVMIKYLKDLKKRHPGSPVLLMNDWLKKYTAACKNAAASVDGVHYVGVDSWVYEAQPDKHPTLAGHKAIGRYLADSFVRIFGKSPFL